MPEQSQQELVHGFEQSPTLADFQRIAALGDDAIPALADSLATDGLYAGGPTIALLGEINTPAALDTLRQALDHPDPLTRQMARHHLRWRGAEDANTRVQSTQPDRTLDQLINDLGSGDVVRAGAAQAKLERQRTQSTTVAYLQTALYRVALRPAVALRAVLVNWGKWPLPYPHSWRPTTPESQTLLGAVLMPALRHPSQAFAAALQTIAFGAGAIPHLDKALHHPQREGWKNALLTLEWIGHPAALEPLQDKLTDWDSDLQTLIQAIMTAIGGQSATQATPSREIPPIAGLAPYQYQPMPHPDPLQPYQHQPMPHPNPLQPYQPQPMPDVASSYDYGQGEPPAPNRDLAQLGLDDWIEKLAASDLTTRQRAIDALVKLGDAALPALQTARRLPKNIYQQQAAQTAIGKIGLAKEPKPAEALAQQVLSPEEREARLQDLLRQLESENGMARVDAHNEIVKLGQSVLPDLQAALDGATTQKRQLIESAINQLRTEF